ncbi:unnamed protein product, partial [Heterotrigona itama]
MRSLAASVGWEKKKKERKCGCSAYCCVTFIVHRVRDSPACKVQSSGPGDNS